MSNEQQNIYVVEQVEMSSDSDVTEHLDDLEDLDLINQSINDMNQLENLINSTVKKTSTGGLSRLEQTRLSEQQKPQTFVPKHVQRLEVVDDFIRNFLIQNNMHKTLESFQKQWYEYNQNSKEQVPDASIQTQVLKDQVEQLQKQLQNALALSQKAKSTYDKLLKQRDFHKMHHQRVQKDKKKLNENIQKLNSLQNQYNKKYDQLVEKYNLAMKDKMLIKIERDKLKVETQGKKQSLSLPAVDAKKTNMNETRTKYTPFPKEEDLVNPYLAGNLQTYTYKQTVLSKTQKGHQMPVCAVVFHPKKPIIGTGSDDMLWKIWTVSQSELIMSGEGHKDWISSMKFHPKGLHIVTASGDSTVKIWDFVNTSCTFTFKDHRQPVWSIDLNATGDYIASGSMDHSCRLFDINVGKCRSVLRGHVDSINSVHFKPYSNLLATASADKTISIWDIRTGLCVQTFYGHQNSVNGCKFSPKGDKLATCDANGIVKVWDLNMSSQFLMMDCERSSASCISIDRSGNTVGVGCDDGLIRLFNTNTGQRQHTLKGHEQKTRVQAIQFDMNSRMIVSGGADCSYRIWQ